MVCLSFGERGESAKLWKRPGMTLERVKAARRQEAENAAAALGVHDIRFFDLGDYPLEMDRAAKFRLVDVIREVQPAFMLSHSRWDPYNTDHMYATAVAIEARMIAQAWGHNPGGKVLGAPQLYLFEPHQTEQMEWKPDVFLDITPVWEKKRRGHRMHGRPGAPLGVLHPRGREPGQPLHAELGRPGRRARGDLCRGVPVGVSAHRGRALMAGVVVQDVERADPGVIDRLGRCGVATVHEAQGRTGLLASYMRPIYAGARVAGSAVTVSVPPGDNWMIHVAVEQVRPGDILVAGPDQPVRGRLFRRAARDLGGGARVPRAGDRRRRPRRGGPDGDGLPGLVEGGVRARHGQGDARLGQRAGRLRRAPVNAGDVVVADDDGVCVVPRARAAEVAAKAEARIASEAARRARLAAGELGLDIYDMRGRLAARGSGMSEGVRCMWMRGGTSKGGYFLAEDLPADRDAFLLAVMGSPDARQIDGMGGADPLTSKVAVVQALRSGRGSTSTTCSCRSSSTGRSSPTARTAATSWPASARSPSSAAWWRRGTAGPRSASSWRTPASWRPPTSRRRAAG